MLCFRFSRMRTISLARNFATMVLIVSCAAVRRDPLASTDKSQLSTDVGVADCEGQSFGLSAERRAMLKPRTGRMAPDDHWADLAENTPGGFAGVLYLDSKPTLMLTHPELAAQAKQMLAADPTFRGFNIMGAQVIKARWDFAQLVDWYNYFIQQTSVWQTPGIVSGDKDERRNRIRFGIQTEAGRQELVRKLAALHIPCDLVLIGIEGPVRVL
jgi:hypothetical protein